MLRLATAAATLVLSASAASAQWVHTAGEDDPFKKGRQHLAAAFSGTGEMAGFRCTSKDDLSLIYITAEKPKPETLAVISKVSVQLFVIIDDGVKIEFTASVDDTPTGDKYRFTATGAHIAPIVRGAAGARKRFAIAAGFMGEILTSQAFGVIGSQKALGALIAGCKL